MSEPARADRRWARLGHAAIVVAGVVLWACAAREVPAAWPEQSAASPAAEAAPQAVVTRALSEAPPLPGESSSWVGLGTPGSTVEHEHAAAGHDPGGGAQGSQDVVVYACPMHPEVVAERPGQCPKCGMALVERDGGKK